MDEITWASWRRDMTFARTPDLLSLSDCVPKGSSIKCPISSVENRTQLTAATMPTTRRGEVVLTSEKGRERRKREKNLEVCLL